MEARSGSEVRPDTAALRALANGVSRLGAPQEFTSEEDFAGLGMGRAERRYYAAVTPDTVRALCDAADEVERLRADRDALREQVQRLRASRESNRGGWARTLVERDALRAAVDRVRALGERDGRDRLAAWLASNGVEQADTVAVEAAAFVLAALESGNYGTPEWFSSIGTAPGSDSHRMVLAMRDHYKRERDAARDEVERLRAAVVERDTRLAETIRYHDARVNRADEATDASRTAHAALDAELRAKVAEARTWRGYKTRDIGDAFDATTVTDLLDDLTALLDRHAPTLTTTED